MAPAHMLQLSHVSHVSHMSHVAHVSYMSQCLNCLKCLTYLTCPEQMTVSHGGHMRHALHGRCHLHCEALQLRKQAWRKTRMAQQMPADYA
jgi:hypothetical protein